MSYFILKQTIGLFYKDAMQCTETERNKYSFIIITRTCVCIIIMYMTKLEPNKIILMLNFAYM